MIKTKKLEAEEELELADVRFLEKGVLILSPYTIYALSMLQVCTIYAAGTKDGNFYGIDQRRNRDLKTKHI